MPTGILSANEYDPVRSSGTSLVCEFAMITYHAYVRFHDIFPIIEQFDSEWGRIDLAGAIV